MLSIDWYIEEGLNYVIEGRENDWKKFCKENVDNIYLLIGVRMHLLP